MLLIICSGCAGALQSSLNLRVPRVPDEGFACFWSWVFSASRKVGSPRLVHGGPAGPWGLQRALCWAQAANTSLQGLSVAAPNHLAGSGGLGRQWSRVALE